MNYGENCWLSGLTAGLKFLILNFTGLTKICQYLTKLHFASLSRVSLPNNLESKNYYQTVKSQLSDGDFGMGMLLRNPCNDPWLEIP